MKIKPVSEAAAQTFMHTTLSTQNTFMTCHGMRLQGDDKLEHLFATFCRAVAEQLDPIPEAFESSARKLLRDCFRAGSHDRQTLNIDDFRIGDDMLSDERIDTVLKREGLLHD